MELNIIEMPLDSRSCECCDSNDLEPVFSTESFVTKLSASYRFKICVVICKKCGFCFSSPVYENTALSKYYADGLSRSKNIMLPYLIEPRIDLLKKYSVPNGVLAEVGGDQADEFQQHVKELFRNVVNIEVTKDSGAEYGSIHDLPPASVDVVAHYDVLEHIPNVTEFLRACNRALKKDGIMICEVPDIRLYPRNLLLLEYEHVNHFSSQTLASIALKSGFKLVEIGHVCSRPFGLVAVFRKADFDSRGQTPDMSTEYLDAKACIDGAQYQIQKLDKHVESIRVKINELSMCNKKITVWCVTELLYRLLHNYVLPKNVLIVDTDPRRQTHLAKHGLEVFQPKDQLEHLKNGDLLIICSSRYKEEIIDSIFTSTGKRYSGSQLEVIGAGPSGESLT